MLAEATPQENARIIRSQFVDNFVINILPTFPNPIRAVNECVIQLIEKLTAEGLGKETFPLSATIGDINPLRLGHSSNGEADPFEQKYVNLADKLALDPRGPKFLELQAIEQGILSNYYDRDIALTQYNPQGGIGTKEVRNIVVEEAKQIGLEATTDQVWMGYGGGDLIERAARSINVDMINKLGRSAVLLAPSVGFSMAIGAIADDQVKIQYLDNSDLPLNQLTGARLSKYKEEIGIIPDMVLLTPANNPNAQIYDPETLRGFIEQMNKINENAVFIFDMAYMWMIPREKANKIMQVIKETGTEQKAMFINSLSKKTARPGSRLGNIVIPNIKLGKIFHRDNMRHVATWSGVLDVEYQALHEIVDESAFFELVEVFKQRQKAMIDLLRDLDPQNKYFKNLDTTGQEVPLYLWVEMQEGVTAYNVLTDLNIGTVPSNAFGPEDGIGADKNHIRISVGFASTYDILSRSKTVLEKWAHKFGIN